MKADWRAALVLAVMCAADIFLTRWMATEPGFREMNPFLAPVVDSGWLLMAKTVGAAVVMFLFVLFVRTSWMIRFMYGAAVAYTLVVLWNAGQIVLSRLG